MLLKLITAFGHNKLVELIGRAAQTISPKIQTQLIVVLKQKHQKKPQQDLVDPWLSITISNAISNVNLQTTNNFQQSIAPNFQ
jgi:hypothetical protein